MSWLTAVEDTRKFLGDGPQDKSFWKRKLLGDANGVNKEFKIFNTRVVVATPPRFYVGGVEVTSTAVLSDPVQSIVTLHDAPINGQDVEASGYFQYWLDTDMQEFLKRAAEQIVENEDYTAIAPGLRAAAQHLAASCAYNNLSSRFTENRSSQFQLSERGENGKDQISGFMDMAKFHQAEGLKKRDEFYKRLGRRNEPAFGVTSQSVPSYTPKR